MNTTNTVNSLSSLDTFHDNFELLVARTDSFLKEAHRLRYQIYCVENGFETQLTENIEFERDNFDDRAVHSLIRHRQTGIFVGTVRLVLPDPNNSKRPFPAEAFYRTSNNNVHLKEISGLIRHSCAEVSRFGISKKNKNLVLEKMQSMDNNLRFNHFQLEMENDPIGEYPELTWHQPENKDSSNFLSQITLGLILGAMRMSIEYKITHWFVFLETSLLRMLCRMGMPFKPIAPVVKHKGTQRQLCIGMLEEISQHMMANRSDLWDSSEFNNIIHSIKLYHKEIYPKEAYPKEVYPKEVYPKEISSHPNYPNNSNHSNRSNRSNHSNHHYPIQKAQFG